MSFVDCLFNTAFLIVAALASGCIVIGGQTAATEVEEAEIDCPPPPSPPTVVITRPTAPNRRHVWIGGHYAVRRGCWLWIDGHWVKPPHKGAEWMPCHTRRKGQTWIWTSGYWI